jgi:CheY-like chemotaxis protein
MHAGGTECAHMDLGNSLSSSLSMPRRVSVVYIDEPSGDQLLIREALSDCKTPCQLTVLTSAAEAVRHFNRNGQQTLHPDLILLDLYPGVEDGCDLVKHIRSVPELQAIPIIVFGMGPHDPACKKAMKAGANDCVDRPVDLNSLFAQIEGILSTWAPVTPSTDPADVASS